MPRVRVFDVPPASGTERQLVNVSTVVSIVVASNGSGGYVVVLNSNATNQSFTVANVSSLDAANAEAELWRSRVDDAP